MSLVLDASMTIPWFFGDEQAAAVEGVMAQVANEGVCAGSWSFGHDLDTFSGGLQLDV